MYEIQQISKQSNQQIIFLKTFVVWLIIIFAEMRHGTARVLWLEPFVGEFRARQIAVFIGSGIILAIAISLIRWIGATNIPQLLIIGVLWLSLTVGFELLLGRLFMGLSWARIASDYNLRCQLVYFF